MAERLVVLIFDPPTSGEGSQRFRVGLEAVIKESGSALRRFWRANAFLLKSEAPLEAIRDRWLTLVERILVLEVPPGWTARGFLTRNGWEWLGQGGGDGCDASE